MDTSEIAYRVADFLKPHPPFSAMDERDLLAFSSRGRVRFHEAHDYLLWQGEPNRFKVFVIQQGTVELWDEQAERPTLRDVRGPGDMLGMEQFAGANVYAHSARSSSDVLLYVFSSFDFESLVLKYPYAQRFVAAYETVTSDSHLLDERREPQRMFLHELTADRYETCRTSATIRDAARALRTTGTEALVVLDDTERCAGTLNADALLGWIADGGRDADQSVSTLLSRSCPAVPPQASVADGLLAMAAAGERVVAITADGTSAGQVHAIVTTRDLAPVFGDQPAAMLLDIRRASNTEELRGLNHRVRAFALRYLTSGAARDWVSHFVYLADLAIVRRLIEWVDHDADAACWCLAGSSGRQESLTRLAPFVVLVHGDGADARTRAAAGRVEELCAECDYLPRRPRPFEAAFYSAGVSEWTNRFDEWFDDPVMNAFYASRALLDLRPVAGPAALWQPIADAVTRATNPRFLRVLANDCLDSLPPLTFFQDAVVEESGAEAPVFELQRRALGPLVDVGRVFGVAAGQVLATSTLDRFAMARTLLPEHESIFREASETLRVVLWQQGRIGISQGTDGAELPPALLSRHDRHVLKGGFRSILRLLEFTADSRWLAAL